ncbi:uncharacterized protein LOC135687479 [Rhopilema esculentum]|uniref:uncharacterized protein LOC135687479 n=1 Tax=Rhopilema esculentum TaxID=499914 RepID=UPI0031DC583D
MIQGQFFVLVLSLLCYRAQSAVDGSWSPWSEWSGWGKGLCDGNQRIRTKTCTSPAPSSDGNYCQGDNAESEPGSIDGGWGDWSQWSTCERPCGGSVVNRTRKCNNPSPFNGGALCTGVNEESKLECLAKCPDGRVDGGFGEWSQWSICLQRCSQNGGQVITRTRQCNSPPPMNGGDDCLGTREEKVMSCFNKCPRDGGFNEWSTWSECSRPCGTGKKTRYRYCNNPEPKGDGAKNCTGAFTVEQSCKLRDCINAVNGSWTPWSSWGQCSSQYCMKGEQSRSRACTNPAPQNGGEECPGSATDSQPCPSSNCIQFVPTLSPVSPVFPHSYMGHECGVDKKYRLVSPSNERVPDEVYQKLAFKMQNFKNGYFNFKLENKGQEIRYCFDPEPAITIKEIADNLIPSYRRAVPFPGYEKPADENRPVTGFSVRVKNTAPYDTLEYDFGLDTRIYFNAGQNMEFRNVSMTYNTEGATSSFMAKGEYYRFSPTIFKSKIFRREKLVHMTGETAKMKIQHVFHFLGITNVPSLIENALRAIKVWDFEFGPCSIGYDFLPGWLDTLTPFRFTATKYIEGIPVHLEIIASLKGTRWIFAIGFAFDGESFGAAIGKINGKRLPDGGFFDNIGVDISVGIMLNPMDPFMVSKHATAFTKDPLNYMTNAIPKGLLVVGQVKLPKDCGGSSFCRVTKKILGPDALFRISAAMPAIGQVTISAGFRNIRLTDTVSFSRLDLILKFNKSLAEFGFVAEVKFPVKSGDVYADGFKVENFLHVGGMITHELGTSDVVGKLYMKGVWRKAFGVKWLAFGNIHLGLTISAESPILLSGAQFGALLEFGENCIYEDDFNNDGHCIRMQVYFGVGKPNTYFYGEVSALTVGKVVRMFGGDTSGIPSVVAETGFPTGAMFSFNGGKSAVDLRFLNGPYIYIGWRVKGTLNLFGWNVRVDIRIGDMEVYIDGECDPIMLGGIVEITRNNTHKNLGPKLFFQYRPSKASIIRLPFFKMFFEGYGKFFGIESYTFINITMDAAEIYIWGKAWDLIYAELYISASYAVTDLKNAHFYVRILIDLSKLTDAIEKARKAVDQAFKSAQATLIEKIDDVKRAKQRCKETLKLRCNNCMALKCKEAEENCKGFFDSAKKWIGGAIDSVGSFVKKSFNRVKDGLSKAGKVIKKALWGWRRRRSLISQRNGEFDLHIRSKRFVSKFICEGIVGGGCKGVEYMCYGTCKFVDYIGQGLCNFLDVAVAALRVAEKVVGWVNAAIQFLMQMFLIHGIRFDLGLGHKFGGGFMVAAEIDLTIFGNRMHFGAQFSLNDPVGSIISAKDSALYNYKEGVKQARTSVVSYDPYDPPNPFSDFDLSGHFGIEATITGMELRLGACVAVTDSNANSKLVLKGCNSTDPKQQWAYTLKGSLINRHSKKCIDLSNSLGAHVVQKDCSDKTNNQKYECDVVTRSLKRRRSDMCVTVAAKTSPKGPGSLSHLGSLKCINVNSRNRLMLSSECQTDSTEWKIDDNNALRSMQFSSHCVRPVGGNAVANAQLEIATTGCHEFGFTAKGSLQHRKTGLCVQTANKEMIPSDGTVLILGSTCNYISASSTSLRLPDPQLLFSFIPKEKYLKMEYCGDFSDMRLDQRFEVSNDEIASICSKFSQDLALHKTAVQSSTAHDGFASRAVDGNYKFHWSDKSCTHTNDEVDPWWRVDLGKEYIITDVTIINRGERGERFKNIHVHIGKYESNHKMNPVCHDRIHSAGDGEAVRVQCNPPIPGRFVAVQMYGKGILTVCEVIVNSRMGGLADFCLLENGGCDQLCFNKCDKRTSCGCLPGFVLAYDGKTCLDIDECQVNNGGCRKDKNAYCSNYPGGYYCACQAGFIRKENSLTECVDIDECGQRNGGCEQMCSNTNGGYLCECRAGFQRKNNDPYGCEDIDECATNNGGCDHNCHNFDGGRYCSCNTGFRLAMDGTTCEEIYCRALEKPARASVSPAICTTRFSNIQRGTSCKFNCTKGFEMSPGITIKNVKCEASGFWDRSTPSCHPVLCSALARPKDGGVVPAACATGSREYGQRCVVYCKHGYRLSGPATKYCQADKSWSTNSPNECVKIVQTPYLNCPVDIQVTLSGDATSVNLGAKFPQPDSNIRISSASHSRDFAFPVGLTVVKFEAVSDEGVKKTCQVFVSVQDKTPPRIINCPADINKKISTAQIIITWPKPTFYDAIGVTVVEEPAIPSGSYWQIGQSASMQYRIYDAAGNSAKCSFKVSVSSFQCPTLTGDQYSVIQEMTPNSRYIVRCTNGRALYGPYSQYSEIATCKDGDYFIYHITGSNNIKHTLPNCVKYTISDATTPCPRGSIKYQVDNWISIDHYCYNCPTGHFANSSSLLCQECPVGFFQDDEGMSECEPCPASYSTQGKGSKHPSDCIAKCAAGTFSPTGLEDSLVPCKPCPISTFSELNGSTECQACPQGTTTLAAGASDAAQCLGAPKIDFVMPTLQVSEKAGNAVNIACLFKGVILPAPQNAWVKVGGSLPSSAIEKPVLNFDREIIGMILLLPVASKTDSGTYKCNVHNQIGSDSRTFQVTIS